DETFSSEGEWLRSIEKRFYALLENLPEGIIEITSDYKIVYANPAVQSMTGLPEEDILASDILRLFDEQDRARVAMLLKETVQGSKVVAEHSSVRLKDNEVIMTIVPIEDDRTHILVLNDVSERKRMEAQLHQAQKMEAVGTLAAGIAHDFNNLLMGIQGNTSLILFNSDVNNPYLENLKTIEKQVESGSRLTKQLLGYARKSRYESAHMDLNELLKETSEIFSHARKEFVICRDFADDLYYLEADRGQMEQVLMNLYINATDAMPEGGILSLKTKNTTDREIRGRVFNPKPGDYVLLKISDTGVGMDEETIKRIFDPFFTTKEMGRGTGLGLASVYGIVKGHGGHIDVQSALGKGTEFSIYFPAAREAAPGRITQIEKGEVLVGSEGVLLVDDEEVIRNVGREMLEALGYRVFQAENGEEAVRVYKDRRKDIHIVLLDMVMPRMGGGEVYDRLKKINRNIVVLLSSGYSVDGEAEDILRRGCNGFIQKPFKMDTLSQRIWTLLKKSDELEESEKGASEVSNVREWGISYVFPLKG
ncbi:MAG: response regulator, partial [Pseudomonadota bacterium]